MTDAGQLGFLKAPKGVPGSGMARYAAAMHFHKRHLIGEQVLEVYRVCAPDDFEDAYGELVRLRINAEVDALESRISKEMIPP